MNFDEVFTKEFLLSHQGRLNRQRYLSFVLAYIGILIVAIIIDSLLGRDAFSVVFEVLAIYPTIMVNIKRCHDRNRSGWFQLLFLIPILNLWALVELYFLAGTSGDNRFGPDRLAVDAPNSAL